MITCNICNTQNDLDAKFCKECGSKLEVDAQPTIDTRLSSLQQSAPKGLQEKMATARSQVRGERRPVTILFTDIVGSTAIASKLDPEDWREIVAGAHRRVSEAIYHYEGTITQLLGDGVLAFFGAPVAHEDDPVRAVHAALGIQESIQEYNQKIADQVESFQMRAGINTGTVVIGDIGTDLHVEYLAFGDAVNVASRLESAAEPGTILVSEDTYKLIAHAFETEDLGTIQVKGKDEPLRAFRVVAPRTRPRKLRGVEGLVSPLVGREEEFTTLVGALERLQAGEGGIATIVGEAGVGKSRLVAEVGKVASAVDVNWVEGRCLSYGGAIPYLLWLDVLREFLRVKVEDSPEDVKGKLQGRIKELSPDHYKTLYPYLGHLLSLPLEEELQEWIQDQDGEQLRLGTFEAIESFIECATKDCPLVLVCEDLHWADPTSIQLLDRSFRLADQEKLLIICVFRPEKDHACWELKEFASGHYPDRYTDIQIAPLSTAESKELVANLVGMEGIPEGLKERILSHAEGNPFYVEEILRSLIDNEDLILDESTNRWSAIGDIETVAIPDTLHGVLLARIDRLHQDTKRVLQMASVIGRIFLYRVLKAIAEEEREMDRHLQDLQEEEMIRERMRIPELEYIFKHHLTQEAAYNGLLKRERRTFHRQVAEALDRLFPDRIEENLGLLAYHWERAEDEEKATEFLLRAGDQARLAYAHHEAMDYYERALVFLREGEHHDRAARTLMKLGLTYHNVFDFKQARLVFDEAYTLRQLALEAKPALLEPAPHPFRFFEFPPMSLDRMEGTDLHSEFFQRNLFGRLFERGPGWEILPDIVQRWNVSEDGRKYTFHLREDVYWSDGVQGTALDFVSSLFRWIERYREEPHGEIDNFVGVKAFKKGEISDPELVGIRALDDFTLEMELERPLNYFLRWLDLVFPLPRHVYEAHGDDWANVENVVTNGPFRMETWEPEISMTLVRNPSYHGHFPGNLKLAEVKFRRPGSQKYKFELYKENKIDYFGLTPDTTDALHQYPEEYISEPLLRLRFIGFDPKRPPFDDPCIRQAFVMAVDRETIVDELFEGLFRPATGGFVVPGIPGHSPGIALPYDPVTAAKLLTKGGYPNGEGFPEVELLCTGWLSLIKPIIDQWTSNLNVDVTIKQVEWLRIWDFFGSTQMFFVGEVFDVKDPDFVLDGMVRAWSPHWRNETFDKLILNAQQSPNQDDRIHLFKQADRVLIEDAVFMPIFYGQDHYFLKPWVKIPPAAVKPWNLKEIIIEPH